MNQLNWDCEITCRINIAKSPRHTTCAGPLLQESQKLFSRKQKKFFFDVYIPLRVRCSQRTSQ